MLEEMNRFHISGGVWDIIPYLTSSGVELGGLSPLVIFSYFGGLEPPS